MYKRTGITVLIAALIAGTTMAEAPQNQRGPDPEDIFFDQSRVEQTGRTLAAFSHAVDLWHDAYLKGDKMLVAKYEEQLETLIEADLEQARQVVTRQQRQASQAAMAIERRSGERRWEEKTEDQGELQEDKREYHRAQNWLAVKKRLATSIAKTEAFSNRLRLFNTYTEALQRQLDSEGFELAKDMRELEHHTNRFVSEKQD